MYIVIPRVTTTKTGQRDILKNTTNKSLWNLKIGQITCKKSRNVKQKNEKQKIQIETR